MLVGIGVTLCPVKDHQAMEKDIIELVKSINDDPDLLHADYTPSVRKLIEKGLPSVPYVLVLMTSESEYTRMRAQRVLAGVTMERYGFVVGKGWTQEDGEQKFRKFWKELGNMRWDDSLENRNKSVALWKKWLADQTQ
jgi:hypothetical protein